MHGLCYTCLSQDRNVKLLDSVFIKSILWEWFDAGGKGNFNVNVNEFKLCWECIAWFLKIYKFKHQVFESQELRLKFAQKKSAHLISLSKLSIYTKNSFDTMYEHGEGANGMNTLKIRNEPIAVDSSNNDLNVSKKITEEKPEIGKHKLSITFINNNGKISLKHSRNSDYVSSKKKKKDIDVKNEEDRNKKDKADKNDFNEDTIPNDNGKLNHLSISSGTELSEDVKLRSQPYVLIKREKHMKDGSNHSKIKRRKRKHSKASDGLEEIEAINTKTDATNVGTNAVAKEHDGSNHTKHKHRKRKHSAASDKFEQNEAKNTGTDATNVGLNPGGNDNSTKELTSDLPEMKFTIVHLTEEQMLKTREIDRNDRIYANRPFKCQTCIIGFLENSQYEKHHNEKHSEHMGALVCPICEIRFKKEVFMKLHQKTHYRSYRCRHCDFEHHRRYVIETHVVKEHGLAPSPVCPDCDMEFDSQKILMSHYEIAHKERLKCNICGESFDTYARVKRHAAIHKGAVDNGVIEPTFHCARCNCNFEGKATYRTHVQYSHKDLAQNAYCADCDVQFSGTHQYTQHLEESDKHSRFGDLKFNCVHCPFKFLTKEALLAHIVRSHRLLSQTCALCNKGFSDPPRLKNHIKAKHPEVIAVKPVKDKICPICSNGFITRSALLDHMRTHKAEKPFQCKKCEKRFAVKTMLKKHIQRMHQEEDN